MPLPSPLWAAGGRAAALLLPLLMLLPLLAGAGPSAEEAGKHHRRREGPVFGCRVPRKYFAVQGFGETDEGSGTDPFETGAHDLAMEDAGIHMFNLMEYTSMLPPEAEEISLEEARKEPGWHHGAVLECIMSEVHGARGDRITAGVGRVMIHKKDSNEAAGGFATEYKGHAAEELAEKQLQEALEELFERRFSSKDHEMGEARYTIASSVVEKSFASIMAGVCFIDYIFPQIEGRAQLHSEL